MAKVKFKVPNGYQTVTASLVVDRAAEALEFYKAAFGAKERYRLTMGEKIGHAEIEIGDSVVMLSDEFPEHGMSPAELEGSPVSLSIYVADADAMFARAVAAGATIERPLADHFYGDRAGRLVDPFGHRWSIQQRLEDVSPKKMQKLLDKLMEAEVDTAVASPSKSKKKSAAKGKR